jgi:D-arabinose 1-dehydrogenase-like Zn-dependent alcohol dehydrogenase
MRGLVLEEFGGPFILKEVETPRIGPYEALVRVCNVGVCGTDLKIRAGLCGAPAGEFLGTYRRRRVIGACTHE